MKNKFSKEQTKKSEITTNQEEEQVLFSDTAAANATASNVIILQRTDDELNVIPAETKFYSLSVKDKNNKDMGYAQWRHVKSSGATQACLYAKNAFDNYYTGLVATSLSLENRAVIPNMNNLIDLGQLASQWRNLHAKKIYENGVAIEEKYTDNPYKRGWIAGVLGNLKLPIGTYEFILENKFAQVISENNLIYKYVYLGQMTVHNFGEGKQVLSQTGLSTPYVDSTNVGAYQITVGEPDIEGNCLISLKLASINIQTGAFSNTDVTGNVYYRKLD